MYRIGGVDSVTCGFLEGVRLARKHRTRCVTDPAQINGEPLEHG